MRWCDPEDEAWLPEERTIAVESVERYVVAEILGPDGEVISSMLDRPEMPNIGFAVGDREPTQWRRA